MNYQQERMTDDVHYLVTLDEDDKVMTSWEMIGSMKMWGNLSYHIIPPSGKIGAINAGIKEFDQPWDILLLASDDMIPVEKGWDATIISEMSEHYPDTDGVLFHNDGFKGKDLNTLVIMGRKYYERFGYIYHPDYQSLWCDNEFMEVADLLGKQTYFPKCIIRHQHPMWTGQEWDQLNRRDIDLYKPDEQTYLRRKANGFDLIVHPDSNIGQPKSHVSNADGRPEPTNKRGRPRKKV